MIVLFVCLSLTTAFIQYSGATIGSWDHYSHFSQINVFETSAPSIWMKNYSVVAVSNPCPPMLGTTNASALANAVITIGGGENNLPCTWVEMTDFFNQFNPVGYMFIQNGAALRAIGGYNPYNPPSNVKPLWHSGIDMFSLTPRQAKLQTGNIILVNYPVQNPTLLLRTVPGVGQLPYFYIGFSLFSMLVAVFKLSMFVHLYGIQFSIAQIVISLSFISSLFWFIIWGLIGNNAILEFSIVPYDVQDFFSAFPYAFTMTSLVILGFYFGEISRLTSASRSLGLDKMRIPAAVFIFLLWAIVLSAQSVVASDVQFSTTSAPSQLSQFFFAWLACVTPFAISALLIWGSVNLILAMKGSSNSAAIIRICAITVVAVVLLWTLNLVGFMLLYNPNNIIPTNFATLSFYYVLATRGVLFCLCYVSINIILCLNFSVSVQKEIEMSKSGTSSTSSSNSKSSTSSSSADPVIEL